MLLSGAYCRAEIVDALLEARGDVNLKDIRGMTPLMLAVSSETQDAAIVRRLVHAGADVNAKSKAGESALDWAKKYGDPDVISILTAEGAHATGSHVASPRRDLTPRAPRAAVETATLDSLTSELPTMLKIDAERAEARVGVRADGMRPLRIDCGGRFWRCRSRERLSTFPVLFRSSRFWQCFIARICISMRATPERPIVIIWC